MECKKHIILLMTFSISLSTMSHEDHETRSKRSLDRISCEASLQTLKNVTSCPKTFTEWVKRATKKQCVQVKQSCMANEEFVYHCVLSENTNQMLEICAARTVMRGEQCPEFNLGGKIIQEHAPLQCSTCAFRYISTDVYKYPECFDAVKKNKKDSIIKEEKLKTPVAYITTSKDYINVYEEKNDPTNNEIADEEKTNEAQNDSSTEEINVPVIIVTTLLLVVLIVIIISMKLYKRRLHRRNEGSPEKIPPESKNFLEKA